MNITTTIHQPSIFVGLDVHKKTISLAAISPDGNRFLLQRVYETDKLHKLRKDLEKLSEQGEVFCVYEASSAGFVLWRKMQEWGRNCQIAAPSLIPSIPGQKKKTDKLDARRLAEYYRAGLLKMIHVPSEEEEAVRDLLRCRATISKDLKRAKNRAIKFLRRRDFVFRDGGLWTQKFWSWVRQVKLEYQADQESLASYLEIVEFFAERLSEKDKQIAKYAEREPFQEAVSCVRSFRGISTHSAMTLVLELGDVRRFPTPKELMSFLGLVPSEDSSGEKQRKGSITKTGNSFCRHVLVQAAWCYRYKPSRSPALKKRQENVPKWAVDHSWKAQKRLHSRLTHLSETRGKNIAVTSVARELGGFVWAVLTRLAAERNWDYGRIGMTT